MVRPRAGFTLFHVLWLWGIGISAVAAFHLARHTTLLVRLAITLAAAAAGVFVSYAAIVTLVIYIVIPHLTRGSTWEYEVDCFMKAILGSDWPD